MAKQTEAHIAANNERVARKYDRTLLVMYKGEKEKVKQVAKENGETVNGFLNRIIAENVPDFVPMDTNKMNGRK